MNRQERRRLERNGNSKSAIMNEYKQELYDLAYKRGQKEAIELLYIMTAYVLNYKMGLGRKRLQKIMYQIYFNIDAFNSGHLTPEDFITIKNEMDEKYGISIERSKKWIC